MRQLHFYSRASSLWVATTNESNTEAENTKPVSSRIRAPLPEALSEGETKPADPQTGSPVRRALRVSNLPAPERHEVARLAVRPGAQGLSEGGSGVDTTGKH